MSYRLILHESLLESCSKHPDKTYLIFNDYTYTYSQTLQNASKIARYLQENGVSKADRVCIFLENSPECIFAILGSILCGAPFSVIDQNLKNDKIKFILQNSEAKFFITSDRKNQIETDFFEENRISTLDNIPDILTKLDENYRVERILPSDLASIIYTSGSTGQPKGVIQTHLSMSFAAQSIISYLRNSENDTIISPLPLSFDYGLYQPIMCLFFGGTLVLERNFVFPSKLFEKIEKYKCTGLPIVPSLCSSITKADASKFDLNSIRYITNTAAHLDTISINKLRKQFTNAVIYPMYGLTECKRVSFLPPEFIDAKPNSVGIPIPYTDVKILQDDGIMSNFGIGELVVRGPHIMSGYWKNEKETKKKIFYDSITKERFLRTGDIFRIDEDGFLYFLSRKDEVIKVKSKKVSLFEIEEKIKEILNIREVCALAIPDPATDNRIIVFYSSEEIEKISSDMNQRIRASLEPYCIPSEYISIPKIPKSTNGKNDKNKLKNQFYSTLEPA